MKGNIYLPFLLPFNFLGITLSASLAPMFSKRSNSRFCEKYHIIKPAANFVSRISSNVTSVLPGQGQANYRHSLCTYIMKRWSSPLRCSANGIQRDWWDTFIWQTHPAHVTSWVCSCTLAVRWGGSKDVPQKEPGNAQAPGTRSTGAAHVSEALQKGDMNSFGSLYLLVIQSQRHRDASVRAPQRIHIQSHDGEGLRCLQDKRVAGSKMSTSFKIPEGRWLDRSPQKGIPASLQIIKWTWITDAVCCKNCQNQNAILGYKTKSAANTTA